MAVNFYGNDLKDARFSPYVDYKYDVYTKLTATYRSQSECNSEACRKVVFKIEVHVPEYDAKRDF